jgi:hypothetical protein
MPVHAKPGRDDSIYGARPADAQGSNSPRRVHWCVGAVPCPVPHCRAARGDLCLGRHGPHWDTHYMRRAAAVAQRKRQP